ncbi:MAG TPA: 2Fe-2S iron-sulfur cluster-binding protein [Sphingobium sp.]|uniref:2Fe-2S iron-sulfur cluster-binding protein n=1 Tax=Sphingobium sp. TaxID=1912891 RepID=UPI002ED51FA4
MAEVTLTIVDRDGVSKQVATQTGAVLMEVLRESVDVTLGTCGGAISCGTCLVQLAPDWYARLEAPGEDEAEMLEALDAQGQARLSCQLVLDETADGMQATISPAE